MLRPVFSLALNPSLRMKLGRSGFHFTADLLPLEPQKLSEEAGLTQQEVLELLQALRCHGGGRASVTAQEVLQKEVELRSIVTFCSLLDKALGGGLPVGKITEICGAPGVGKTLLSLQVAVDVQVPRCLGGVEGQVVFVDTEGSLVLQRVQDVAAATVRHCSLLVEDEEQHVAMETFTVDSILSNIFLVRCHDYVELLAELQLLPDFLRDRPRIRLLVIDSLAFAFREQQSDLSGRTRVLRGLAQQLVTMATTHNIAVVVTNQMTTRLHSDWARTVPALGETWGHTPNVRLLLRWEGLQRVVAILKSPGHMDATLPFQITCDGFRDTDQSEQTQRKRPPTYANQSAERLTKDHR